MIEGKLNDSRRRAHVSPTAAAERRRCELAIAARSFAKPSETFIRDHVRIIAPGRTALLCEDATGTEAFDCPVLAAMSGPVADGPIADLRRWWGRRWGPGLQGPERARIASFLRDHQVAALLAEYGQVGVALIGAARDANVPLYVHFHGYDATEAARKPKWAKRYASLFDAAAGVIAPSRFLADRLAAIGCPADRLHISPNGVDPSRFQPSSREPGRVLAVGRLVEKKAPHLTIQAFTEVKRVVPHARLDVVGDGPLMDVCRGTSQKLGIDEAITFHGAQPSDTVRALLEQASVFAQHSVTTPDGDTESFGVSLVEAMASEVPVVATRHNGFADTVADGRTGCLVAEHDVAGMAAAIIDLLEDPDKAARMGAAGRTRVLDRFTHDNVAHRLRPIFRLENFQTDAHTSSSSLRAAKCR